MSAKEDPKNDDPIARAIQRREADRGVVAPTEPGIGGGMDAVGVTRKVKPEPISAGPDEIPFGAPRREKLEENRARSAEPEPAASDEPPTFFTRSRDERAEAASRAAQRVRRREQVVQESAPEPEAAPAPASTLTEQRPVTPEKTPTARLVEPDPATLPGKPVPQAPPAAPKTTIPQIPDFATKAGTASATPAAPPPKFLERAERADAPAPPENVAVFPVKPAAPVAPVETTAKSSAPAVERPDPVRSDAPVAKTVAAGGLGALIERASDKKAAAEAAPPEPKSVPRDKRKLMRAPVPPPTVLPGAEFGQDAPLLEPVYASNTLANVKTKAFAPFEWMVASRYLRARKKEGFVSVIAGFSLVGIALGVATLIVVMAVMSGFRETLVNQVLGVSAHMNVTSQTEKFENYDTLAEAIRQVDGVTRVSPVVDGQVLATGNRNHTGVVVRGMRKEDLEKLNVVKAPEVASGSIDTFAGDNGVAIGANIAAKLNLRVGDFITLISPDGDITPFSATPMPRKKNYKVLYVFKLGLHEYDSVLVYMPLSEAQIYFNKKGVVDSLEVITDDPSNVDDYTGPVRQAARQSVGVYTWKDLNGSLIGALDIERKVMFVILTMIILVAALNIISGLVMLVKDKGRDVAIMRTMGMARGSILRIFFVCGASIGVIGSVVGVILGVAFTMNIQSIQGFIEGITGASLWDPKVRMLSEIPSKLVFSDVALTLFIALGLSFLATLYPAWKAAKLDPVEALRYE